MGFEVREAQIEDLDAVVELWRELSIGQLSKDPFYSGSLEFNGGYNQLKHSIESENCGIFVFEKEGQLEGFIEIWSDVKGYQLEQDDCAYIVHCIFHNQRSTKEGIIHLISSLYHAAEDWAVKSGKQYMTADVFWHNKPVAILLKKKADMKIYKTRMVRKI